MPSYWGKGNYGQALYSQSSAWDLAGGLTPRVAFAGDFTIVGEEFFAGNLAPKVTFSGPLTAVLPVEGNLSATVSLAASSMISAPLWGASEPCPPTMWTPAEPCDPVEWEEAELCHG